MGSIELIYNDVYEELGRRALCSILLVVIIYIISEIILLLSFGAYFFSSFFRQCEYPNQDPYKLDEDFFNKTKIFPRKIREKYNKSIKGFNNKS